MQPYPPLGTLYAASLLRSAGISVALFDSMLTNPEQSISRPHLSSISPRIVVVYEDNFNFLSKMCLTRMRDVAYRILEASQRAGCTCACQWIRRFRPCHGVICKRVFGVYSSARRNGLCWNWFSISCATAALTFRRFLDLPTCTATTGELVQTASSPLDARSESIAHCRRGIWSTSNQYATAWKSAHGFFSLNIVSSRGCPYRCNWCAKPIYGDRFRCDRHKSVAEEMRTPETRFRSGTSLVRR